MDDRKKNETGNVAKGKRWLVNRYDQAVISVIVNYFSDFFWNQSMFFWTVHSYRHSPATRDVNTIKPDVTLTDSVHFI